MSLTLDFNKERFSSKEEPIPKEVKRRLKRKRDKQNRAKKIRRMYLDFPNCYYCGEQLTRENRSIDHYIPRCQGGSNRLTNLVTACKDCNQAKGNSVPPLLCEWRHEK